MTISGHVIRPVAAVLTPFAGGLLVAGISRLSRRDLGGYGMPAFLEAVNLRGAAISIRTTLLRTLAAVVTLGSGGSAGVEGPVAALGGATGAAVARSARVVGERFKLLVACGSSAAIAAAYGAPITGVFFTQEIVLAGNYDLHNFVRVVVASATATVVARALRGDAPTFAVAPFRFRSAPEILLYLALGVGCGLLGPLFQRTLYGVRDLFRDSRIPAGLRPALGGLIVGLLALAFPGVLGDGAEYMQRLLGTSEYGGMFAVLLLGGMVLAKILATSATLGSGGAGGVFGPSLFLGATLGAAVGSIGVRFAPDWVGLPGHYAIVGMGAFLAATTRAPLTAIFLVFEMTGSSSTAVFPTLIAVAAALYVARRMEPHSIDEVDLARRGIILTAGREGVMMARIPVSDAMSQNVSRVASSATAIELHALLLQSRSAAFIVEDSGAMIGILTLQDLRALAADLARGEGAARIAGDLATRDVKTIFRDDNLENSLAVLDRHGYRQLPVVTREEPLRVIGMLERRDVLAAYSREAARRAPAASAE